MDARNPLMLRRIGLLAVALVALVGIVGCSGLSPQPPKQKVLVIADSSWPSSFDPGESANASLVFLMQVYDGLTWRDAQGNVQPALATSWRTIDDTTWEFKLRQGVKFHNGAPFNAQAVKFTMDWTLDPKRTYARKTRIAGISETRVVDDYTIVFKTKDPFPLLPLGLRDIPILEPSYVKEKGDENLAANPMGTGPFKFVEWRKGDRMIVQANPDYWGGRPKVDRVEWRQIAEAATRAAALKAGEIQIIGMVPIDLLPELQASSSVKIAPVNVETGAVMTFNLFQDGPLKNVKVREAIDYAIDKQAIWRDLYKGYGVPLDGQILTKGSFGYNSEVKARPYDPDRAKKLLAEAGYPNGFTMEFNVTQGKYLMDKEMTIAIAGQLAKVGINVKVNLLEMGVFNERQRSKQLTDAHTTAWYNFGDADFALIWFTKGSGREYWDNPEYDKLVYAGRTTLDKDKRLEAYRKATQLLYEQLPFISLLQMSAVYGVSNRVTGWQPFTNEMLYVKEVDLKD